MTITISHVQARHLLARSRGVPEDGPTDCAVCGPRSPFGWGRPAVQVFGPLFSDLQSCVAPHLPDVCAGCVSLMAGRPGDDPPPMRSMHCVAVPGQPAVYPGTRELAQVLRDPPAEPHVVVWAASRKRHASLRAQISTPQVQLVGSDEGTIQVQRRHLAVLDAVEGMLGYTVGATILAGGADPFASLKAGGGRWEHWRSQVAPHKDTLLLDLLVAVATKRPPEEAEEDDMLSPEDRDAVYLVATLAHASAVRAQDGLQFWKSLLRRRVAGRSRLDLADCVSRLMADLQVEAFGPGVPELMETLTAWDGDRVHRVQLALRKRTDLICASAYAHLKEQKERKDADSNHR